MTPPPPIRICERCFHAMTHKQRPQTCPVCGHVHEKKHRNQPARAPGQQP